jgi:hypothetical protein
VEEDPTVRDIWAKQKPDGSWYTGGAWHPAPGYLQKGGYTPVSPKYVTTVWVLRILGECGYTVEDPRIRRAVDWTLGWQLPDGYITEDRRKLKDPPEEDRAYFPCRFSIMTSGLAAVGAATDPRGRRSLDLLARLQRGDGGWVSQHHLEAETALKMSPFKVWTRSCPWVSHFAAESLHLAGLPEHRESLLRALRFIVWHMEQKQPGELRHIFFRGHEPIRELEMLAKHRVGLDSPQVRDLLDWLAGMYDADEGHFAYSGKPLKDYNARRDGAAANIARFRGFHAAEPDWLTLHALRVAKSLTGS